MNSDDVIENAWREEQIKLLKILVGVLHNTGRHDEQDIQNYLDTTLKSSFQLEVVNPVTHKYLLENLLKFTQKWHATEDNLEIAEDRL